MRVGRNGWNVLMSQWSFKLKRRERRALVSPSRPVRVVPAGIPSADHGDVGAGLDPGLVNSVNHPKPTGGISTGIRNVEAKEIGGGCKICDDRPVG